MLLRQDRGNHDLHMRMLKRIVGVDDHGAIDTQELPSLAHSVNLATPELEAAADPPEGLTELRGALLSERQWRRRRGHRLRPPLSHNGV